jgi:hypothetical protein
MFCDRAYKKEGCVMQVLAPQEKLMNMLLELGERIEQALCHCLGVYYSIAPGCSIDKYYNGQGQDSQGGQELYQSRLPRQFPASMLGIPCMVHAWLTDQE